MPATTRYESGPRPRGSLVRGARGFFSPETIAGLRRTAASGQPLAQLAAVPDSTPGTSAVSGVGARGVAGGDDAQSAGRFGLLAITAIGFLLWRATR